jgi:hypothetical protein
MIPVEGHKGLFRDEKTNAIINCNDYQYDEYIRASKKILDEKNEIDYLKNEVRELKSLISNLINNKS